MWLLNANREQEERKRRRERGGEFGTMREEGGQKMEGGIKLGKVCGLRQQQCHIPSWNAVIISLSLLPSSLFSSHHPASLVPLQQNPFLKPKEKIKKNRN